MVKNAFKRPNPILNGKLVAQAFSWYAICLNWPSFELVIEFLPHETITCCIEVGGLHVALSDRNP